ncbi:MAG: glycosyltransferase [Verrucomicrobiota bacterium]
MLFPLLLVCALIPATLFLLNFPLYRKTPQGAELGKSLGPVSLLIPARDEESNLPACLQSIQAASEGVEIEVLVLDDASTDRTPEIVEEFAREDPRIRYESAPPLPPGWVGKPHACGILAQRARYDRLLYLDADVRLEKGAIARILAFQDQTQAEYVSGFPRQITGTLLEKLLIPLIQWVLLGFLSLLAMRLGKNANMAAGCGQLLLVKRAAYQATGGHHAISQTVHDALQLARLFRKHGYRTDLFDATDLAHVRMYDNARDVWEGLRKNAREGVAWFPLLPFVTLLLLAGQVAPFALLPLSFGWMTVATLVAIYLPRLLAWGRYRQSLLGAILHPVGILLFLAIQWHAIFVPRATWRGRTVN